MVDIKRLSVFYGKQLAVNNLSLTIPRGEVFGFIGPNGAGKTTTIKVLATLLKPSVGSRARHGHRRRDLSPKRSPEHRLRSGFLRCV